MARHEIEFQQWVDGRRRKPDFMNAVQSLTTTVVTERPWKKDAFCWTSVPITAATRAGAGSLTATEGKIPSHEPKIFVSLWQTFPAVQLRGP